MNKIRANSFQTVLLAAVVAAFFWQLGALPLLGPDEPRYAQVAREMFERGDFVTPTLGGFHWFEKPALLYWLQIVSYHIFGVNEFAARFGSQIFGLLTVLTIFLLCRFVEKSNANDEKSENSFSYRAFLVSISCLGLIVFSHAATFDIILTFPIAAALACFFVAENIAASGRSRIVASLFGFYFFIGLALLAKGLIGAVLPFAIVFWYCAALRKLPNKSFLFSLTWGAFVILAVAATWYLPMYLQHGWKFIDEFFIQHHFARYTSNKFAHPEPFWFFWAILPVLTLPWLPAFLAAIWRAKDWNWKQPATALEKLRIFALVWVFVPTVFFSFSGSKLPGYILPALPAALILAAFEVKRFADSRKSRAALIQAVASFVLIATSVPLTLALQNSEFIRRDTSKFLMEAAAERGFTGEKVLNLHDISHSLEFYAAGRTVRDDEGKQHKFLGATDILQYMNLTGENRVLVVVPPSRLHELLNYTGYKTEVIADNGEYAITGVSR